MGGERKIYWRCFHCGDAFTKAQVAHARKHFGATEDALPVCQLRLPGAYHLLAILRKQEDELAAHRAEDTDLWRAFYSTHAGHATALRREEERGYEKGLADARVEHGASEPDPENRTNKDQPQQDKTL